MHNYFCDHCGAALFFIACLHLLIQLLFPRAGNHHLKASVFNDLVGILDLQKVLQGQVKLDSQGYVLAGESTQTNLPGVYAAGDIRTKPLRQIVTAAADGATAAHLAARYLGDSASPET